MDDAIIFRMSAFSEQGGRKYMEDVVEIRIEYEPTPAEDYLKTPRHGGQEATSEASRKEPGVAAGCGPVSGPVSGPVCAVWTHNVSEQDGGSNSASLVDEKDVVDTRKSVAFFAVFDGHGGREAAHFAREHLWDLLKRQRGFWSKDHSEVCAALRKGFIACHHAMWKELRKYVCVCLYETSVR